MSFSTRGLIFTLLFVALGSGCKSSVDKGRGSANNANGKTSSVKPDDQGLIHSGSVQNQER